MSASAVETTNPYLAACHVHNERHLSLAESACNWHLIAGGLLLATINRAGGLVYATSKQQVIPSVVAVDEASSAAAIKELQPCTALDPLGIAAQRTHLLTVIRTRSTNDEVVRRQIHAASQQCRAPAQQFRTRSSTENTLPKTLKYGRVFPVHLAVSPRSPQSGQARWKAPRVGHAGMRAEEREWEAPIERTLVQTQSTDEPKRNPLGRWLASLHGAPR